MRDARGFAMRPTHHQRNTEANVCHLAIDMISSAEAVEKTRTATSAF